MIRKALKYALLFLLSSLALAEDKPVQTKKKSADNEKNIRKTPLQNKYDDPNQPEVVKKTSRHPEADKLEVDYD